MSGQDDLNRIDEENNQAVKSVNSYEANEEQDLVDVYDGGKRISVLPYTAFEGIKSGKFNPTVDGQYNYIDQDGNKKSVKGNDIYSILDSGATSESLQDSRDRIDRKISENKEKTSFTTAAKVAGLQAADEFFLGVPEEIYKRVRDPEKVAEWEEEKRLNPGANAAGGVAGFLLSNYLAPGIGVASSVNKGALKAGEAVANTLTRGRSLKTASKNLAETVKNTPGASNLLKTAGNVVAKVGDKVDDAVHWTLRTGTEGAVAAAPETVGNIIDSVQTIDESSWGDLKQAAETLALGAILNTGFSGIGETAKGLGKGAKAITRRIQGSKGQVLPENMADLNWGKEILGDNKKIKPDEYVEVGRVAKKYGVTPDLHLFSPDNEKYLDRINNVIRETKDNLDLQTNKVIDEVTGRLNELSPELITKNQKMLPKASDIRDELQKLVSDSTPKTRVNLKGSRGVSRQLEPGQINIDDVRNAASERPSWIDEEPDFVNKAPEQDQAFETWKKQRISDLNSFSRKIPDDETLKAEFDRLNRSSDSLQKDAEATLGTNVDDAEIPLEEDLGQFQLTPEQLKGEQATFKPQFRGEDLTKYERELGPRANSMVADQKRFEDFAREQGYVPLPQDGPFLSPDLPFGSMTPENKQRMLEPKFSSPKDEFVKSPLFKSRQASQRISELEMRLRESINPDVKITDKTSFRKAEKGETADLPEISLNPRNKKDRVIDDSLPDYKKRLLERKAKRGELEQVSDPDPKRMKEVQDMNRQRLIDEYKARVNGLKMKSVRGPDGRVINVVDQNEVAELAEELGARSDAIYDEMFGKLEQKIALNDDTFNDVSEHMRQRGFSREDVKVEREKFDQRVQELNEKFKGDAELIAADVEQYLDQVKNRYQSRSEWAADPNNLSREDDAFDEKLMTIGKKMQDGTATTEEVQKFNDILNLHYGAEGFPKAPKVPQDALIGGDLSWKQMGTKGRPIELEEDMNVKLSGKRDSEIPPSKRSDTPVVPRQKPQSIQELLDEVQNKVPEAQFFAEAAANLREKLTSNIPDEEAFELINKVRDARSSMLRSPSAISSRATLPIPDQYLLERVGNVINRLHDSPERVMGKYVPLNVLNNIRNDVLKQPGGQKINEILTKHIFDSIDRIGEKQISTQGNDLLRNTIETEKELAVLQRIKDRAEEMVKKQNDIDSNWFEGLTGAGLLGAIAGGNIGNFLTEQAKDETQKFAERNNTILGGIVGAGALGAGAFSRRWLMQNGRKLLALGNEIDDKTLMNSLKKRYGNRKEMAIADSIIKSTKEYLNSDEPGAFTLRNAGKAGKMIGKGAKETFKVLRTPVTQNKVFNDPEMEEQKTRDYEDIQNTLLEIDPSFKNMSPEFTQEMIDLAMRQDAFMKSKIEETLLPGSKYTPNDIRRLRRYREVRENPWIVFDYLGAGLLRKEHVEAVDAMWPSLGQDLRRFVIARAGTINRFKIGSQTFLDQAELLLGEGSSDSNKKNFSTFTTQEMFNQENAQSSEEQQPPQQ